MAIDGVGSTGEVPPSRNTNVERPREREPEPEPPRRESPPDRGRVESRNSDGDRSEVSQGR